MIKKEFKEFAKKRGFTTHYSGKLKKHFLKFCPPLKMNIHELINSK